SVWPPATITASGSDERRTHASSIERGLTYSKGAAFIHQAGRSCTTETASSSPRLDRSSSRPPHFGGGVENGANDLVVTGAAAEMAGEPVANLGFGRVRIPFQQRLGRNENPGRAETALQ